MDGVVCCCDGGASRKAISPQLALKIRFLVAGFLFSEKEIEKPEFKYEQASYQSF